jgi:hypothetical protein
MLTFAFNPAPEWPAFAADWVPELGWTPPAEWVTPEDWQVWTAITEVAPAAKPNRSLFGGRKPADDTSAVLSQQLEDQLSASVDRETALGAEIVRYKAEVAEYKTVRRGLDKIGALEPLDLLLELNNIGATMQAAIAELELTEIRERDALDSRLDAVRAQIRTAEAALESVGEAAVEDENDNVEAETSDAEAEVQEEAADDGDVVEKPKTEPEDRL